MSHREVREILEIWEILPKTSEEHKHRCVILALTFRLSREYLLIWVSRKLGFSQPCGNR